MNELLILDPEKLREARGARTLDEIAEASGGTFKPQQLSAYERGLYRPRLEKVPALLRALGVRFDQVAKPLDCVAA